MTSNKCKFKYNDFVQKPLCKAPWDKAVTEVEKREEVVDHN